MELCDEMPNGYLTSAMAAGKGDLKCKIKTWAAEHFSGLMQDFGNSSALASGPRLNIKTVLSTYGDFHVKDKTAVRTSYL